MKKHYNLEHLVKIHVLDQIKAKHYFYVESRTTWYGKTIPAHIQFRFGGIIIPQQSLDDNMKMIGNDIFYKPKTILYFSDNSTQSFIFNTHQEAIDKAEHIKNLSGIWITVIES